MNPKIMSYLKNENYHNISQIWLIAWLNNISTFNRVKSTKCLFAKKMVKTLEPNMIWGKFFPSFIIFYIIRKRDFGTTQTSKYSAQMRNAKKTHQLGWNKIFTISHSKNHFLFMNPPLIWVFCKCLNAYFVYYSPI